jgi:hypothetical protein
LSSTYTSDAEYNIQEEETGKGLSICMMDNQQ